MEGAGKKGNRKLFIYENNFIYMKITSESIIWKSGVALKLLLFFFENASPEFYESQIKKRTELSMGSVNRYLKLLAEENFLLLRKKGKMNFYRLNRENIIAKHLKITYSLSNPAVAQLKEIGKSLGIKLYLYGSVARGEDDEKSDWDVLAIGNIKTSELEKEIRSLRKRFNKEIRLTIFTSREWLGLPKKDAAFYQRLEKDRIELV